MTQTIVRPWNPVQVLVLVLVGALISALVLAFAVPAIVQAQSNEAIEYAENGKDAVATFTANDPEGGTSITWGIAGVAPAPDLLSSINATDNEDSAIFTIDGDGTLEFANPPDYETPGDVGTNNIYQVVVTATDAATNGLTGFHEVTVKVTNVPEQGKVTWTVAPDGSTAESVTQFDVGALLTATATDGDISGATKTVSNAIWRWYRSADDTSTGTLIEGADAQDNTYTTTLDDAGMYLRAVAHYVISGNVDQETASLTSDYPVLAERVGTNQLEFDPLTESREVAEGDAGRNVGARVTAEGNHGAVYYTLGGTDVTKFDIDEKTGQITTMVDLDFEAAAGDGSDNCSATNACQVTVTARDASGDVTDTPATVNIKITDVDEPPTFPASAVTAVTVPEGRTDLFHASDSEFSETAETSVTYTATDPETRNIVYTLMGLDSARFKLSNAQVLSFRANPDFETPTDRDRDNVYEVTVRASDGTMNTDRAVKVTVIGINEAPVVTGRDSVNYTENSESVVATFTANDPEGGTSITWGIAGVAPAPDLLSSINATDNEDSAIFTIDGDGTLEFANPPDYETPGDVGTNNIYQVVVTATDAATNGLTGFHEVTVKVTNVPEQGKVTWTVAPDGSTAESVTQFDVGALLTATATDGDIAGGTKTVVSPGATNIVWRWFRGGAVIQGEAGLTYTVALGDVGQRIRASVTYQVGTSTVQETASLTSDYPVLAERVGTNQLEFDPLTESREVAEGDAGRNVGARVTAEGNHGAVYYTLGGTDVTKFDIDEKTGQITTMVDLDFEAAAGDGSDNCSATNACQVTVTARDASGDVTDTPATVNIKITDVDEPPTFDSGAETVTIDEGVQIVRADSSGDGVFDSSDTANLYVATDEDGLNVNLSLLGPDAADFSLSSAGVLSFVSKPDYENPVDVNTDNLYEVTVRASDGTKHADRKVRVTVEGINEAPVIALVPASGLRVSGDDRVSVAEGTTAVTSYTASGPNQASARWTLSGTDAGDFRIGSGSGVLTFAATPDFEAPADGNGDNVYEVTVTATDSEGASDDIDVTVTVTDVDETTPSDPLLAEFDPNGDGRIEVADMRRAVGDFFGAIPTFSEADMRRLVGIFFTQS